MNCVTEWTPLKLTSHPFHRESHGIVLCWAWSPALKMWKSKNTVPPGAEEWGDGHKSNNMTKWPIWASIGKQNRSESGRCHFGLRKGFLNGMAELGFGGTSQKQASCGRLAARKRRISRAVSYTEQPSFWTPPCRLAKTPLWWTVREMAEKAQNWDPGWRVSLRKYGTGGKEMASS